MKWDASNYLVEIDKDEIVIKTLNKKYYKRFFIPDLRRKNLTIQATSLSVEYTNQTLVVSYEKPEAILLDDKAVGLEIAKIRKEIQDNPEKKYGSDCKNQ